MAVMRNSIIFGGVNSADFGIYISGEGVFNAPKRAVEYVQVPGRSGAIAMDLGYYENIEVEYPAFNYEPEMADFIQALRSFRNAICSQTGYQRLNDTFHPDEYRMAVYSEGLEVDPVKFNTASEFTLKFNCKPQRYLLSGEAEQTMGEWGDTETATGNIVTVENPDGVLAVKSLQVSLEPIQSGSGTPSPDNVRPISGRSEVVTSVSGKNLLEITATDAVKGGVSYTINADGSITANGTASGWNGVYKNVGTVSLKANVEYILSTGSENIQATYYVDLLNGTTAISTTRYANVVRFTPTTDMVCTLDVVTYYNKTVENKTLYPMVRVASDSDSTFETYQGNTYTTSLGQTVYGGTLDVVSGELTVDRAIIDGSNLTFTYWVDDMFYSNAVSGKTAIEGKSPVCECYILENYYNNASQQQRFYVKDASANQDASIINANVSGKKFAYYLATPTTVQLTPQEIELLTGTNHLWSGGEVTLEYGDNPAILYNPTPFDASPLLEVEGYGSIEFNGYTIEIDEGFYGIVDVADAGAIPTDTVLQTEMFNDGDTITIKPFAVNCHFGDDTYPFESPQVTNTSGIGTTAYASGSGTKNLHFKTTFAAITFASNTDYSSETKATLKATLNRSPLFSPPQAEDITINISYTASTHTVSITVSSAPNPDQLITPEAFAFDNPTWNGATADSTKSTMTGTTYIDCDLGDAYKIENGEYASLNSYIDLGSDLPTLASGANEVVFSNTITSLKIIPRWWIL